MKAFVMTTPVAERLNLPNGYTLVRREQYLGGVRPDGYYTWEIDTPIPSQTIAVMADDQGKLFAAAMNTPSSTEADTGLTAFDYEEVLADHRRLVRELDVALNGEEGAAKQASLCDIVAQVLDKRWKLVWQGQEASSTEAALREASTFDGCFTGLSDADGNRVYFGDVLDFDEKEWGGPYSFTVTYKPDGIAHAHDIPQWCRKRLPKPPTQEM
jgi:hypothetical protein